MNKHIEKFLKEWVLTVGVAFVVAFGFRSVFYSPRHIPTGSMIPTIRIHEFIFVNMHSFDWHYPFTEKSMIKRRDPAKGDIVVFEYPEDPSKDYIKRVVATPGDSIEIRDKRIILNGTPLSLEPVTDPEILESLDPKYDGQPKALFKETNGDREYLVMHMLNRQGRDIGPVTVPANSFFVMGDNRDDSQDSRYWGFVPRKNLIGEGSFIWLSVAWLRPPFIRFGRLFTALN